MLDNRIQEIKRVGEIKITGDCADMASELAVKRNDDNPTACVRRLIRETYKDEVQPQQGVEVGSVNVLDPSKSQSKAS
jgi:hypothetical protein